MQYWGMEELSFIVHEFQYRKRYGLHAIATLSIGEIRVRFQYRKRYGLHAIKGISKRRRRSGRFNTASGMDCMQYVVVADVLRNGKFQYRKRYGLHAIPSLTALGTAEPRSGFSKRIALFGKSPQPRGIFLSPKSAENVRKPCNIKETFVHGKNLKLMAFSPKSLPSL